MTGPQIIVLATPLFFLLIAIEWWVGRRRGRDTYRLNDALNSIGLGVMSQLVGVFGAVITLGVYTLAFEPIAGACCSGTRAGARPTSRRDGRSRLSICARSNASTHR